MPSCPQNPLRFPEDFYQELLGIFRAGQHDALQQLSAAIATLRGGQALDARALESLLHQRKGEAGMMEFTPFHQVYAALHRRALTHTLQVEDLEEGTLWIQAAVADLEDRNLPLRSADALLARLA